MEPTTAAAIEKIEDQLLVVNDRLDALEAQIARVLAALKAFQGAIVTS